MGDSITPRNPPFIVESLGKTRFAHYIRPHEQIRGYPYPFCPGGLCRGAAVPAAVAGKILFTYIFPTLFIEFTRPGDEPLLMWLAVA
jgi:hypothetical protein